MIITRTPFRVSFAGGGSDLKAFYSKYEGFVVSQTINKYMYITVNRNFDGLVKASYSKIEEVKHSSELQHPLIKACLEKLGIEHGVSIASQSDIPAGTGLGSSSSFTVGLLNALYAYKGNRVTKEQLAREACEIEIDICGSPIGKQDQYAAAYGGLNYMTFNTDGSVSIDSDTSYMSDLILDSSLFFYLDLPTRDANVVLQDQSKIDNSETLIQMTNMARGIGTNLRNTHIHGFGEKLDYLWRLKKSLSTLISSSTIDEYYNTAIKHGATGGKVLGAGGSGFLMVYAPIGKHDAIKQALSHLKVFKFKPEFEGSKIIYDSSL